MSASTAQTTGNSFGEIKGIGPAWACDKLGAPGHNYHTCITCLGNFMTRNDDNDTKGEKTA